MHGQEDENMAGDIKGITIEFRGNATPLQKAIRQVDSELAKTTKELSQVNKALKFNPTSVDLWRQKQNLLKQKIGETEDKLDALKQAQKQMDDANVDKNSEAYRRLQRQIIETESQLKTFKSQLRSIGNVNLRALGEKFQAAGKAIEGAGNKMRGLSRAAGVAAGAIGGLAVASGKWADNLNTLSNRYSIGTDELQKYGAASKLVDVDVETITKSHVKLEKTMYSASKGTGASAEAFEKLGVSVTDADGNLRDGDQVWNETIAALGQMENETERDALAMQLMGKSAADLNPLIEDGGETYKNFAETIEKYNLDFIDQETLDNAQAFNDQLDTIKAIGLLAFQELGTQLAAYLAPALERVVDVVGRFAEWITGLDPRILAIAGGVAAVLAAVAPVLIVIGKIATGVGALIKVVGLLAGPVGIVIAVIAALVAIGIVLYKNWDTIKAKALTLGQNIKTAFNNIKTAVANALASIKSIVQKVWNNGVIKMLTLPIRTAVAVIRTAINTIKSIINGAHLKLPHFKLPHFKISGGKLPWGIGGRGTPPKISVDWYAKGGIFNAPNLIGVGEAGPEAVVPLDRFWEKMDQMQTGQQIVININGANRDPREIAEEVRRILIRETNQRRLAWQ